MTSGRLQIALLALGVLLLLGGPCWAKGSEDSNFSKLVEAVRNKDDAQAMQTADSLEEAGELSYGLYYNKGLSERNLGHYARARASFEKALTYEPRSLQARRRLREVKEKLDPQLPELDVKGTPPWDATEAELVLGFLTLLLMGAAAKSLLGRPTSRTQLAVAACAFALCWTAVLLNNPPAERAILISSGAKLLASPASDSTGQATINGTSYSVLEHRSHYLKVRDRKGHEGWLREAEVAEI